MNVGYVDAPVSGGVAGAVSGSLSMMVGTSAELFAEIEPMCSVLARNRFRIGDEPGQGQAMKLLNNYVSAAALAATCEAAVFGQRLGLDLSTIVDVLNVSSGRSAASQDKFPRSVIPRSYDFGFAGSLMTKDVSLYLDNAQRRGSPARRGQRRHQPLATLQRRAPHRRFHLPAQIPGGWRGVGVDRGCVRLRPLGAMNVDPTKMRVVPRRRGDIHGARGPTRSG